jgi:uncharacterized membrane protein
MSNELPYAAERIANDYVDRLSDRLKGMPAGDRDELLNEIRSHIYDSYMNETTGDEIERILTVLRKLGEPEDVITSRMAKSVEELGRSKKAPLYILAAILIALFAVPLGLGAIGVLIGLLAALFGLVIAYYGLGVTLVVGGFVSGIASFIASARPDILERINYAVGYEVFSYGPDPQLVGFLGLIASLIQLALGVLILWSGKYLWRGFRFVAVLITQKVTKTFKHLTQSRLNKPSSPAFHSTSQSV